jgi:hypothetical protein
VVGITAGIAIIAACSDDDAPGTGVVLDGGADAQGSPRADGGPKVERDSAIVGDNEADTDCDGNIVINELEPAGDGGAEFVELFNSSTNCSLSLANFKLMYRSGSNVPGVGALHTFGAGDAIRSKQFLLFANDKFVGKKDGDLSGSMGNAAGQVALVNDVGDIVDAVGYGNVTDAGPIKEAGPFTEKKAVPVAADTVSVGRKKDGVDTDDNAADFKSFTHHTAGVSNE